MLIEKVKKFPIHLEYKLGVVSSVIEWVGTIANRYSAVW